MNYAHLDKTRNYNFRAEREELAEKLGYGFISESIVETYKKTGSTRETAAILGMSFTAILMDLRRCGIKLKGRGGPNHIKKAPK